ncbi:MAG: DUF1836 domain-containing protein [Clostridiales bacterium]
METYLQDEEIKLIGDFHCPRYEELPKIPLYKEQVIQYIEETFKPLNLDPEEKLLTPTMLNNYVKQKIVSPPKNRKYDERHIAYLIVVCLLKQAYSLREICQLITIQIKTAPIEQAYDFFCVELENALSFVFKENKAMEPNSAKTITLQSELVRSVAISLSYKLFIQRFLIYKKDLDDKL